MRILPPVVGAFIALMTAAAAIPAAAAADPAAHPGAVTGMSAPAGVVQTPDGNVWVADDAQGLCRVAFAAEPHLVESPWCQPEAPDGNETHPEAPHVEEGPAGDPLVPEVVPVPSDRPGGIGGLVFDPATDNFYAADVASGAGGVWRMHLDRATGTIDGGELIASAGVRVQSVALAPPTTPGAEPDVLYLTKRGGVLMRIADPATAPKYPQRIRVLGDEAEIGGMVTSGDTLYLADGGVSRVSLADDTAAAERLSGLDDVSISAVAVDPARGRLYAGSSNLNGEDVVKVVDLATGQAEPYELGFAAVTALGLDPDGRLLVTDDPGIANGSALEGLGRMWRVDMQPLGRPQAQITAGPKALTNAATITLAYQARDGATFECRLDDGPYEACTGTGSGERSWTGLRDGEHRLQVRATDSVTGLPVSRRFRLDRTAPNVGVVLSVNDITEGDPSPRLRFAAYEWGMTYTCTLDGVPFSPCGWDEALPSLSAGDHVVRVVGVDAAGNSSDPSAPSSSVTVRVRPQGQAATRPVATPRPAPAPAAPAAARAPAATAPAAATAGTVAVAPDRRPVLYPFTLRFRSAAAPLRFGLRAAPEATTARIAVKNWLGRTVITRVVMLRPGSTNRVNLTLTRSEQRRLRPGRYLVRAVLRTARGTEGNPQTHWMRVRPAGRS
jgi:hypothetical protein